MFSYVYAVSWFWPYGQLFMYRFYHRFNNLLVRFNNSLNFVDFPIPISIVVLSFR